MAEVLSYLEYDPRLLVETIRRECETAVRRGLLSVADSRRLRLDYEAGLASSTYLETAQ